MSIDTIELDEGKYTVIQSVGEGHYRFEARRYGENWRDLAGDKLVYSMFCRILKDTEIKQEVLAKLSWLSTCSDREMQDGDKAREIAREIIELIEENKQ